MDMFPQTTKQRKRLWIYSLARKNSKDIQPIVSSHVKVDGCAVDVLDTTGAGDGFVAAFLYRLGEKTKPLDALDERDLEDALRFANTFAALSARHLGAMDAYPSLAEVEAYSMKRSASNL